MTEQIRKNIKRFTKKMTQTIQDILYVCGISIHNKYTDECVSDFSCCYKDIHTPFRKRVKSFCKDMQRIWG